MRTLLTASIASVLGTAAIADDRYVFITMYDLDVRPLAPTVQVASSLDDCKEIHFATVIAAYKAGVSDLREIAKFDCFPYDSVDPALLRLAN